MKTRVQAPTIILVTASCRPLQSLRKYIVVERDVINHFSYMGGGNNGSNNELCYLFETLIHDTILLIFIKI